MSDASPRASRLTTPRWLDARLVVGVVLILVAVVSGARVFASADHFSAVYLARQPLVPGERLAAGDLAVGQVRFSGDGASYIAASERLPEGYLVTRYVAAGELVPITALAAATPAAAPSRFVTVPVVPGHLPDGISHGDLVDVYLTPKSGTASTVPMPVRVLASAVVDSYDGGVSSLSGASTVSVVLVVPLPQVAAVIHAVESGTIDLVRVPPAAAGPAPSPAGTPSAAGTVPRSSAP